MSFWSTFFCFASHTLFFISWNKAALSFKIWFNNILWIIIMADIKPSATSLYGDLIYWGLLLFFKSIVKQCQLYEKRKKKYQWTLLLCRVFVCLPLNIASTVGVCWRKDFVYRICLRSCRDVMNEWVNEWVQQSCAGKGNPLIDSPWKSIDPPFPFNKCVNSSFFSSAV